MYEQTLVQWTSNYCVAEMVGRCWDCLGAAARTILENMSESERRKRRLTLRYRLFLSGQSEEQCSWQETFAKYRFVTLHLHLIKLKSSVFLNACAQRRREDASVAAC